MHTPTHRHSEGGTISFLVVDVHVTIVGNFTSMYSINASNTVCYEWSIFFQYGSLFSIH